ncbi:MAG: 5'-3' exonuclease H3TH domain-containing protein, partial [Lachnospiraceae bacterium]|nr:5'-3' exonuclease H3TH domain-containing protein [Lachnospiraceae bacterium]
MSKKLVLIDGHSILNRAFYGIPDLTNAEGLHTNAVYGFLNILFKILDEEKPDYLTVAFDVHAPTFRHKMYDAYKGTRKPMAEELRQQVPLMKEMLQAMGVRIIEKEGYEADDIIGTIAKRSEKEGLVVSVVSGDRDLLQLATDHIKIRIPKTKRTGTEIEDYNAADVKERYQVTPVQFIDVKALMGDTADNIPGVPGIGEKTATNLIVAYGSIEEAYAHVDEIKPNRAKENLKEHYDMAQMSKTLATIEINADIDYDLKEAELGDLFTEEAYLLCKRLEFKNLLAKFDVSAPQNETEQYFRKITELSDAEAFFAEAAKEKELGFFLVEEKDRLLGVSVSFGEKNTVFLVAEGFLTEDYLLSKLKGLLDAGACGITFSLKPQLHMLPVREEKTSEERAKAFFDTEIAAYLLNPLKNEYSYEDLAKDYLGMMIPSRTDLLGKLSLSDAAETQPEAFLKYVCFVSYVA